MPPLGWKPSPEHRAKWRAAHDRRIAQRPRLFWTRVRAEASGCWTWQAGRTRQGYGTFSVEQRPYSAHRYAWELVHGPIPDGLYVLHHCDNPPCVRPDHLFLGTHADNMRDMSEKGRGRTNERWKITDSDIGRMREMRSRGETCTQIARTFAVSTGYVSQLTVAPDSPRRVFNRDQTSCVQGHPFTPENTYIHPPSSPRAGRRSCRECRNRSTREYYARRRAS